MRNLFGELGNSDQEKYAGKVLLFNRESEDIIFFADTLDEVNDFIRDWDKKESPWCIIQGPPKPGVTISLNEIEDRGMA